MQTAGQLSTALPLLLLWQLQLTRHVWAEEPEQVAVLEHKPALAPHLHHLALALQPAGLVGRSPVLDRIHRRQLRAQGGREQEQR